MKSVLTIDNFKQVNVTRNVELDDAPPCLIGYFRSNRDIEWGVNKR